MAKTPSGKPRGRPRKGPPAPPAEPPNYDDPNPQTRPLTEMEQRFVDEYMIDRRAAEAYRRIAPHVGFRNARDQGKEMYGRPHVKAEIAAATRAQSIRCGAKADAVIQEIARIAFFDPLDLFDPQTNNLRHPRQIPIDTRRCIASVKVSRERRSTTGDGRTRTNVVESLVEYKFWPKNDALGKLASHLGLNVAIPPLESLLALLPPGLSQQVRLAIHAHVSGPKPSTNGVH